MKKLLPLILLSAVLFIPQYAFAGTLTESCFPIVFCPPAQDAYAGSCQAELNSVSGATPSCVSVKGAAPAGQYWAFSCDAGCYLNSSGSGSVDPCPGGIMVAGQCLIKLNVVDDSVPVTGEKAYKIWDGFNLTEVIHVGTAGCPNNEIPVSDSTSATGWKCGNGSNSGLWSTDGTNVWRPAGKVGIGTATPGVFLDVEQAFGTGGAATIGASTNVATGGYAIAVGANTSATGDFSAAFGLNSSATNWGAVAMGSDAQATGIAATAFGDGTIAVGYSLAAGSASEATGSASVALGDTAIASGDRAVAIGGDVMASGNYSLATNRWTVASGGFSTAMGIGTEAEPYWSMAVGSYNVKNPAWSKTTRVMTDPLFVIGRGSQDTDRSNAMTVLKNGFVGISTVTPAFELDVADGMDIADTLGTVNANQYCLNGASNCVTSWPKADIGWYVGLSATAKNGSRSGYTSANNECLLGAGALAGSHICTAMEMISTYNNAPAGAIASLTESVWVNNGPPGYISNVANDCEGWSSSATTIFGYVWNGTVDSSYVTPCNEVRKFACCK